MDYFHFNPQLTDEKYRLILPMGVNSDPKTKNQNTKANKCLIVKISKFMCFLISIAYLFHKTDKNNKKLYLTHLLFYDRPSPRKSPDFILFGIYLR